MRFWMIEFMLTVSLLNQLNFEFRNGCDIKGTFVSVHSCLIWPLHCQGWCHHTMLNLKIRSNLGFSPFKGETMKRSVWSNLRFFDGFTPCKLNFSTEEHTTSSLSFIRCGPDQWKGWYVSQTCNFSPRMGDTMQQSKWHSGCKSTP